MLSNEKGNMIKVPGIAWIKEHKFGTVYKKITGTYEDSSDLYTQLKEKEIIQNSIKNFGRFDRVSKNTCLVFSMALYDSGVSCLKENMQNVGVLSTNRESCLQSNLEYFKDYVDCGRTLSRGNLFIYTLPSTPIAEAAINFGCQGPVAYFTFEDDQTNQILEQGRMMIELKETTDLLIVNASEEEAICFYITGQSNTSEARYMALNEVQNFLEDIKTLSEVIKRISRKGKE
ncbi:MAG: hypothetical protein GY941_12490 [Planctomycetes bacterium]|nr:hypothetical protein [Planctomycetota bacterium]